MPKPGHAAPALESRIDELRGSLKDVDPFLLANRIGGRADRISGDQMRILLSLWASPIAIAFPDLIAINELGQPLPAMMQATLLYHLVTSDGALLENRWVSFADLPGGRMYAQAFQSYSGDEVVKTFGVNIEYFKEACLLAGGSARPFGDASFAFAPLPRVPLMLTYHLGDEDFPSACKVLFDSSACHYLPIDGCAILGSMLTRRVMKFAK